MSGNIDKSGKQDAYGKKLISFFVPVFFSFSFLMPDILLAQEQKKSSAFPSSGGFVTLILFLVCYMRRKKAIGGWLLYFLIQFYGGVVFSIIMTFAAIDNYTPGSWDTISLYVLYLLTTVPGDLLLLAQVIVISLKLIPEERRDWKSINLFRLLLLASLFFSIVSLVVDLYFFPDAVAFAVFGIAFPVISLLYFSTSKRVRAIYLYKNFEEWLARKENYKFQDAGGKESIFCKYCHATVPVSKDTMCCPKCGKNLSNSSTESVEQPQKLLRAETTDSTGDNVRDSSVVDLNSLSASVPTMNNPGPTEGMVTTDHDDTGQKDDSQKSTGE